MGRMRWWSCCTNKTAESSVFIRKQTLQHEPHVTSRRGLRHRDSISLEPLTFTTRVAGFSKHFSSKLIFPCGPDRGAPRCSQEPYSHIQLGRPSKVVAARYISLVLPANFTDTVHSSSAPNNTGSTVTNLRSSF